MAACCAREARESAREARWLEELRAVDPSETRNRERGRVFSTVHIPPDDPLEDSDDAEFEAIRHKRLRELRAEAQRRAESSRTDCGGLVEERLEDIEVCVRLLLAREPDVLVLHLSLDGWAPSAEVDELLRELAREAPDVLFVRASVRDAQPLPPCLASAPCPGVLVSRAGGRSAAWHDASTKDGDHLDTSALLERLRAAGVTSSEHPGSDDEGRETEAWLAPCEICGRTYPHEHVRAIRPSLELDGEEGDD